MPGHPDWQDYAQWIGDPLVVHSALAIPLGTQIDGPFEVGNFRSLLVVGRATGARAQLVVSHLPNGAPAGLMGNWSCHFNTQPAYYIVPMYSDRITSIVTTREVAGTILDLFVAPTNQEGHLAAALGGLVLINVENSILPAGGGTASFAPARLIQGRVKFRWLTSGAASGIPVATGNVVLNQHNYQGSVIHKAYYTRGLTNDLVELVLGPSPWSVHFENPTASDQAIWMSVIAEGR